jgi:four helix bundle protein
MQDPSTTRPHTFHVLEIALQAIGELQPIVGRIRRLDRDLSDQLRRALSSVALNIGEGNRSDGGHRTTRFSSAAGSASEARVALRVAAAWGYLRSGEIERGDELLDRVLAMLHRLGARR